MVNSGMRLQTDTRQSPLPSTFRCQVARLSRLPGISLQQKFSFFGARVSISNLPQKQHISNRLANRQWKT